MLENIKIGGINMENKTKKFEDILRVDGIDAKGFGIIPKMVMMDKDLTLEAKSLYAYFCSLVGNGSTCFPGRSKILFDLRISKDYYYKSLNLLKQQGYITIKKEGQFPQRNIYTLVRKPSKFVDTEITTDNSTFSKLKYNSLKAGGFGTIPRILMIDDRLNIKAKGIYAYFASLLGGGNSAFPRLEVLLHHLNISQKTYYKYSRQLVELNYITKVQRRIDTKFGVNDYYLNENPDPNLAVVLPLGKIQDNERNVENTNLLPLGKIQDSTIQDSTTQDSTTQDSTTQDTIINSTIKNSFIKNKQSYNQDQNEMTDKNETEIELKKYEAHKKIVAKNIEYEILREDPKYTQILDNIYELLVEYLSTNKKTIRIAGEEKNANIVKNRLLQIKTDNVLYVMDVMNTNRTKINNIENYLLTVLYKSTYTTASYYDNQFNSTYFDL
jgi:hypothetical protein